MAVFSGNDMKRWREMHGMTAADLAERISCDVTTIYRYESGKLKPNPDVMYQICYELGDVNRWCDWMATEYPSSYGRVHPSAKQYDLTGNIMSMYAGINDMLMKQYDIMNDAADGNIDDKRLEELLRKQTEKIVGRGQILLNMLNRKRE